MRQQDWKGALHYLQEAEKLAPQVSGIRLNIGLAEYRQGDYVAAISPFESVLRDEPGSTQVRHLLGLCYLFEERYGDAATTLEPLWQSSDSDLTYLYSLAVAAGKAARHDLEQRAVSRLLEVGKDSPLLHLVLGKAYLARGDLSDALRELQIAAQGDPKLSMVHYNLGVAYRGLGNLDKARQEFLADIAIEPQVAFSYDQLGSILYIGQQETAAETYFRDAVARDPKLGTSWFGLAKIYKGEKRYADALRALDQAAAIDSKSSSVHYLRAQILAETGHRSESETELAIVRRLKDETRDKLEEEITGTTYHDPDLGAPDHQ
jgi:tetratricopeptide (TPR) repeat protein